MFDDLSFGMLCDFIIGRDRLNVIHFIVRLPYLISIYTLRPLNKCFPKEIYESKLLLAIDFQTISPL